MGLREIRLAAAALGACLALPAAAAAQTPGAPVTPIPTDPFGTAPEFEGSTATVRPIKGIKNPPRHPFMAPNGRSNLHNDAYQTDSYRVSGPLGDGAELSTFFARECGSITFDSQGRIVTVCVGLDRPVLALLDPQTLQTLAAMPLPPRTIQSSSGNPFNDFSGGGYFYLDHRDRAVLSTTERHLLEVGVSGSSFVVSRDYSLVNDVPANDGIISVLPDWSGRLWFVTRGGRVGTVERGSGAVRSIKLEGEGISNSFAVDKKGGVFIVSDKALYRFVAGSNGGPKVTWRAVYPNSAVRKPGQSDAGSGTTPTLMGKKWVTITDNADPMNIRVYRRAKKLKPPKAKRRKLLQKAGSKRKRKALKRRWRRNKREVCHEAVFDQGKGSTDQSLIVAGGSIIAENNYGYSGPAATEFGGTTEPGLARVDVIKKKKKTKKGSAAKKRKAKVFRCREVWESQERAPSVVPKLSLANGLVYTYTKPPNAANEDPWYLTALDFRTGATVYRRLAADGLGHNNNFAPVTLGPDGTAYVGALGGLIAFKQ